MRIAEVAPLYESVPPRQYGGTERVVSYLTEELVQQGHDVTLYASGDSVTAARLVAMCPQSLWNDRDCHDTLPHHVRLLNRVAEDAHRYDVIHFHCDYLHFPYVARFGIPTVTTLHGPLFRHDHEALFRENENVPLVSISNDQRVPLPWANWQATVYHGLPRNLLQCHETSGDYLAFLGRFSPEKGLDTAIEIARRAGMHLKVAAKMYSEEKTYFDETIAPLLKSSPWVEYVGEVNDQEKNDFLGNAKALIFPINWSEPFGLVMIESLACGTPVVAYRRGSVPEVIHDGETGYIVDGIDGAVAALQQIDRIKRRDCRIDFERRFDAAQMAKNYVAVFQRLAHLGMIVRSADATLHATTASSFCGPGTPYRARPALGLM
jgi:glycosyltransferase involved in cell wall biosynthesis